MSIEEMSDTLTDQGIATPEEIDLVTNINGYTKAALKDILYARTGYRTFGQLKGDN